MTNATTQEKTIDWSKPLLLSAMGDYYGRHHAALQLMATLTQGFMAASAGKKGARAALAPIQKAINDRLDLVAAFLECAEPFENGKNVGDATVESMSKQGCFYRGIFHSLMRARGIEITDTNAYGGFELPASENKDVQSLYRAIANAVQVMGVPAATHHTFITTSHKTGEYTKNTIFPGVGYY